MKAKIVATIGPSCANKNIQEKMLKAGLDVARFNFSYGKYEEFEDWAHNLHDLSSLLGKNIAILADLQGPRIRIKNLKAPFSVNAGPEIVIGRGSEADLEIDAFPIIPFLKTGERILLNDGMIVLRVVKKRGNNVVCKILSDGEIKPNSSINFPDSNLHLKAITKKDKEDLKFALRIGVDFVALSFVQKADDILKLKRYIKQFSGRQILPRILAKIETDEAIKNIDEIIKVADGIMIARGDLGIEIDRERVPMLQKEMIKKCLLLGKPTIVATQMLASMTENPLPTRAEVSDIANAVLDGADACMLSNETAVGDYPVYAVREMQRVFNKAVAEPIIESREFTSELDHLALSACDLAKKIGARTILAITKSGFTAKLISKHRPNLKVIALAPQKEIAQELSLYYGLESFVLPKFNDAEELLQKSVEFIKKQNLIKPKEKVVLLAGHPAHEPSSTNLLKIITI